MSILDELTVYGEKWEVKNTVRFSESDIEKISKCEVKQANFGLCICIHRKDRAGVSYIQLSKDSKLSVGDVVDPSKLKIIILAKADEPRPIQRIEEDQ